MVDSSCRELEPYVGDKGFEPLPLKRPSDVSFSEISRRPSGWGPKFPISDATSFHTRPDNRPARELTRTEWQSSALSQLSGQNVPDQKRFSAQYSLKRRVGDRKFAS